MMIARSSRLAATRVVLALFVLVAFVPPYASAFVAPTTLEKLIERSSFIGVVEVERIYSSFPLFWRKTAVARVVEQWKGNGQEYVTYNASPTWTCDMSWAEQGETVVLFLSRWVFGHYIVHSGRGRMKFAGDRLGIEVDVPSDIRLPASFGLPPDPYPLHQYVPLASLRRYVEWSLNGQGASR